MSNTKFGIENNTHECQECGMKFYNSHELVNHIKKFCTGAGLNSLQGLAQYENSTNMSKKLKNYGAHSLGSVKYEPVYNASQLAREAKAVADHREQLAVNRPYSNTNANAINMNGKGSVMGNQDKYHNTDQGVYEHSVVQKVKVPGHYYGNENISGRSGYGQRVMAGSEVSIQSLGNFARGAGTKHQLDLSNSDRNFHSPPTQPPLYLAKHHGPSVLDKSTSSIAKMSVSQKHDYATDKLIELDTIAEMYDKSGGMSMDFRRNLDKMRKFYQKMLEDDQPTKQYPGEFVVSRVQTPINKLRDLGGENQNKTGRKKDKNADSLDHQVTKLSTKKAPNNNINNSATKKNIQQEQPSSLFPPMTHMGYPTPYQQPYQPPYYPQPFNPYTTPPHPQIIMMPSPYQQTQSQPNSQINEQIKYFQKMIEVKNQQNKKLMQMLIESKREKNPSIVKEKVQKIRLSRISNMDMDHNNNIYHMETPMDTMPMTEQKILLALQRQELDQLRLLSSLPEQLQKLKMQSVMKLIQQRTQLQKQILQQKVKRLQQQKKNQLYEQKVRLDKDQWANEERKKLIGYQMNDVIDQFKRKVQGEDSEEEEEDEGEEAGVGEGQPQQQE